MLGYLLFGLLAWLIGRPLVEATGLRELIVGSAYLALALLLIRFGFSTSASGCAASRFAPLVGKAAPFSRKLMPELLGFGTGLNLCPPFLLAFTEAMNTGTMLRSLVFFSAFFWEQRSFSCPCRSSACSGNTRRFGPSDR